MKKAKKRYLKAVREFRLSQRETDRLYQEMLRLHEEWCKKS